MKRLTALIDIAREIWMPVGSPPAQIDGWVVCGGPSMEPTVAFGQRVRVRPCRRPIPGDVVVFRSRTLDVHVLHRVVLVLPGLPWLVHRGDAPSARPGLAAVGQVVGLADLPRRSPSVRVRLAAIGTVARSARNLARRLRGTSGER